MELLHGAPRVAIGRSQAVFLGRTMQHVTIQLLNPEVIEGASQGLLDLCRYRRVRVVGSSVVLPVKRRELCLDEHIATPHSSLCKEVSESLTDALFVVM